MSLMLPGLPAPRLAMRPLATLVRRSRANSLVAATTYAALVACADLRVPPDATSGKASGGAPSADSTGEPPKPRPDTVGGSGVSQGGALGESESGGVSPQVGGQESDGLVGEGGAAAGVTMGAAGTVGAPPSAAGVTSGGSATVGAAGASGDGGASPDSSCPRVEDGPLRAWLLHDLPSVVTSELHPFVALTTTGPDIPLKELSIRYYFKGEGAGRWQAQCLWVTQTSQWGSALCERGVAVRVLPLSPATATADRYLEISFPNVQYEVLSSVAPPYIEARTRLWEGSYAVLNQSNDYSFVPTLSATLTAGMDVYTQTNRVTIYRNGTLVWGEEPCL